MIDFTFDGTIKKLTAIADCVLSFVLVGAGGAPGGYDRYGPSTGTSGDTISGKVSLKKGDILYCAVGSRGLPGVGGWGTQAGGVGGTGINGFSGGRGGNSGPYGASGSGGGGGAATVLWRNDINPTLGEVTYTYSYVVHKASYNISNFSPYYLTRPLSNTNGFFVRSGPPLNVNSSINDQREYWVIIDGTIVYHSTTAPPTEYFPSSFIESQYALWETWPGGGDYITIYDVQERIKTPNYGTNNIVAIAAGGGGGGGGGNYGPGYKGDSRAYAYSRNPPVVTTYNASLVDPFITNNIPAGASAFCVLGYTDSVSGPSGGATYEIGWAVVINGVLVYKSSSTNKLPGITRGALVGNSYIAGRGAGSDFDFVQCYSFTSSVDGLYDTRGAAGQYHRGDGGGAGGGGGGFRGGSGGTAPGGDTGGQSGSNGMSYISTEVTPTDAVALGSPGLYGGNFSLTSYDNDTSGYAAFNTLQTNAFVYVKNISGTEYTKENTPTYYPKAPYLSAWEGAQEYNSAPSPDVYTGDNIGG